MGFSKSGIILLISLAVTFGYEVKLNKPISNSGVEKLWDTDYGPDIANAINAIFQDLEEPVNLLAEPVKVNVADILKKADAPVKATGTAEIKSIKATGLKKVQADKCKAIQNGLFSPVPFDCQVVAPKTQLKVEYNLDVVVQGVFPINGAGSATIDAGKGRFQVEGTIVGLTTTLELETFDYTLELDPVKVTVTGIMGNADMSSGVSSAITAAINKGLIQPLTDAKSPLHQTFVSFTKAIFNKQRISWTDFVFSDAFKPMSAETFKALLLQ